MATKSGDPFGIFTSYQTSENGFQLKREPESKAYLSWRATCLGCKRSWGEWEQFAYGDTRGCDAAWNTLVPLLRNYLHELGFTLLPEDAVLCPECLGKPCEMAPLGEGVTFGASPWFTTRLNGETPA